MPSQPDDTRRISPAAAVYLAVAATAATTLAAVIVAGFAGPFDAPHGVAGACAAAAAIAGIGYIVRNAEDRIAGLFERMEAKLTNEREAGYASGFVDGAAGGRHLTAVNDR